MYIDDTVSTQIPTRANYFLMYIFQEFVVNPGRFHLSGLQQELNPSQGGQSVSPSLLCRDPPLPGLLPRFPFSPAPQPPLLPDSPGPSVSNGHLSSLWGPSPSQPGATAYSLPGSFLSSLTGTTSYEAGNGHTVHYIKKVVTFIHTLP